MSNIGFMMITSVACVAEGFLRRRLKCEKLTDDSRRTMDANAKNE
jgi:hypothetical protein